MMRLTLLFAFVIFINTAKETLGADSNIKTSMSDFKSTRQLRGTSTLSFEWPIDELFDDALLDSSQTQDDDDPFKDSNDDKAETEVDKEDTQGQRFFASNDNMDYPSGSSSGQFKITLMNMGFESKYDNIFVKAARRWEKIIVGDLPNVPKQSSSNHDWFGSEFDKRVNIDIDDILIGYQMETIDGEGSVLGYAGPVYRKKVGGSSVRALSGIMKFDKDDFDKMPPDDIQLVIIHEMGHVLGIGTFWNDICGTKCSSGATAYTCSKANAEYKALGYSDRLQLESKVCGHWSEDNFGYERDEIMTPYFDENKEQPISRITIAALSDLGYEVNFNAADTWKRGARVMTEENEDMIDILLPSKSFTVNATSMIKPLMYEL